jgi:hypothetical protein
MKQFGTFGWIVSVLAWLINLTALQRTACLRPLLPCLAVVSKDNRCAERPVSDDYRFINVSNGVLGATSGA